MNIRETTPLDLFPIFLASSMDLLDILVNMQWNARGEDHLRRIRTPLPGIFPSRVHSLCNKLDGLQLLVRKNRDFLHLPFYASRRRGCVDRYRTLHCSWQASNSSEGIVTHTFRVKRKVVYINSGWLDVTVIQQHCSPELESFFINCKLFYFPPQLLSLSTLTKVTSAMNSSKYRQLIKCPTREENILDHCHTTVNRAYYTIPWAALGHSDHVMVHLIPAHRQKLKLCKLCEDIKAVAVKLQRTFRRA